MFTVYVAAHDDFCTAITSELQHHSDVILAATSSDLRVALDECARDNPGVLAIDNTLLTAAPDLIDTISRVSYPIVLLASPDDPSVGRQALTIGAQDIISMASWDKEMIATLNRVATPLGGRDKKPAKMITIFSSKGGVGKTTLSVNLAVALAEKSHQSVALVDLDLNFGNVSSMMGLSPKATIHDLVFMPIDPSHIQQVVVEAMRNVTVLAAPRHPEEAEDISVDALMKIFRLLKEDYAYIIVDMAPGYGDINVITLDLSDIILTVCTPDVVTLKTVGQALHVFREEFRYPADKVRLVLNRTGSNTGIESQDIMAILKNQLAYELPSAGSLPARAANEGISFVHKDPQSRLSQAVSHIARELTKESQEKPGRRIRRGPKRGILSRLRRGS